MRNYSQEQSVVKPSLLWRKNCSNRESEPFYGYRRLPCIRVSRSTSSSPLEGKIVPKFFTALSILLLIFVSVLPVSTLTPHRCLPVEQQAAATHCAPVKTPSHCALPETPHHEKGHDCGGHPFGVCCATEHGTFPTQHTVILPEQSRRVSGNDAGKPLSVASFRSPFDRFSVPATPYPSFQRRYVGETRPSTRLLFLLDASYWI